MAHEIELTINSNSYADNWESITIHERLNDITDVSIDLYATQANFRDDINNGKTVVIGWNDGASHNLFQGAITDVDFTSDDSVRIKVQDDGTWALVGWNTLNYDYKIEDEIGADTIVNELCSEGLDGSSPWICEPGINTCSAFIAFRAQNTDRLSALKRLSEHMGYDWWISWSAGIPYFNFECLSGIRTLMRGTAESGSNTTITDTDKSWDDDVWIDYMVVITAGTGVGQERIIEDNDATSLTISSAWDTNPSSDSEYVIVKQIFYTYGTNQNVADITRKRDTSRIKNAVYVLGFGDGDPTSGTGQIISDEYVSPTSVSTWGRHEIRHVDRSITTVAEADRLAMEIIMAFKDPINIFTLTIDEAELILPSKVKVGDSVMIKDNNIFFAAEGTYNNYMVLERKINFTPGAREIQLVCASKNWDVVNEMSRMFNLIEEQSRYNLINELRKDTVASLNATSISEVTGSTSLYTELLSFIGKISDGQNSTNQEHPANSYPVPASGGGSNNTTTLSWDDSVALNTSTYTAFGGAAHLGAFATAIVAFNITANATANDIISVKITSDAAGNIIKGTGIIWMERASTGSGIAQPTTHALAVGGIDAEDTHDHSGSATAGYSGEHTHHSVIGDHSGHTHSIGAHGFLVILTGFDWNDQEDVYVWGKANTIAQTVSVHVCATQVGTHTHQIPVDADVVQGASIPYTAASAIATEDVSINQTLTPNIVNSSSSASVSSTSPNDEKRVETSTG